LPYVRQRRYSSCCAGVYPDPAPYLCTLHPELLIHVVSHTHWDREWYHTAGRFRQRLVALIDELLDGPASAGSFLLDGQTVVLDDYLEVRPERASDVATAMKAGRLEAGPWFVLPDELIPGGEGLVRNLLAGARSLRALRAESPPVLYCPDSFGHPAALPVLARGFDKAVIILWRGLRGPRDAYSWERGSARVLVHHLSQSGYELGANLPVDAAQSRERWQRINGELAPRAATDVALLLNGADHHARQRDLGPAVEALRRVAMPDQLRSSTLAGFTADFAARAASATLWELKGELRDSYGYTWSLQGTLGTRAQQKRRYKRLEHTLVHDVEPWLAFSALYRGASLRHLARMAWRDLLLCQPHDSLCGCSIDEVASAVDERIARASAQADGLREDAVLALVSHDREAARAAGALWRPLLVVRNPAPYTRSGVAIVELTTKMADAPVGPGSQHVPLKRAAQKPASVPDLAVQVLDVAADFDRTEAARAYPDNDIVQRVRAAVWVGDVPGFGIAEYPLNEPAKGGKDPVPPGAVTLRGRSLSNGRLTLKWDSRGQILLTDAQHGRTVRDLVSFECRTDVGDLYTPAIREPKMSLRHVRTRAVHRGPLLGMIEQEWTVKRKNESIDLRVRLSLEAGAPFVRVGISGNNAASDHRLRVLIRSDVGAGMVTADAAFGLVQREPPKVNAAEARMESPILSAPLHRYVSAFDEKRGITLYSDGLAEYEMLRDSIAITLVRAVGELSRSNLRERPGHAGWPVATPKAQSHGPFGAELAAMLHGTRLDAVIDAVERTAADVLNPLTGVTLRSALTTSPPFAGVSLEGAGLAFSTAKETEDGAFLALRCVNLLDRPVSGAWKLGRAPREARLARLDETPGAALVPRGDTIPFDAAPLGVVTILVR
jgi:mannosylglycerate hydrolase